MEDDCSYGLDDSDLADDEDADYTMTAEDSQPRATPRRMSYRVRRASTMDQADGHLLAHRRKMALDKDTRAMLLAGLRKNRFCSGLTSAGLEQIVSTMEYFEFEVGDVIMMQGLPGKYFFLVQHGKCEIAVNGAITDTAESGASFGGIALLYDTSRSATVTARAKSGIWGAAGATFRAVLREHSKQHYMENRELLERIRMFDGMSAQRKARIGKLALLTEVYEAGRVVIRRGTPPPAVYVVKSGTLFFRSPEGVKLQTLRVGDCFCWRSVLYSEVESADVVVEERCELVGMGVRQLKKALGEDLGDCLLQSFALSVLRKSVVFSQVHPKLSKKFVQEVVTSVYPAGKRLQEDVVFAIIVDGSATVSSSDGAKEELQRGRMHQCAALSALDLEVGGSSSSSEGRCAVAPSSDLGLTAGANGCRLATLSKAAMGKALRELELSVQPDDQNPLAYIRKALLIKKVPVFRELSISQVDGLVAAMEDQSFPSGAVLFRQGDPGDALYFIKEGGVSVSGSPQGDEVIRQLGKGACFGERSLLCGDRRTATVRASEGGEELKVYSVSRQAFRDVLPRSMREQLVRSVNLQGVIFELKALKHVRLIGAGSFGSVRLVEHKNTAFQYALKRIRKKDGQVPEEVTRECNLLAENAHPFLLQYVGQFVGKSSIYILTELITGGQLYQQVLEKMGILSRKHAQFYMGSICLTLAALHDRNITYRDLKPENVMLDSQGYLKLVDFGLAKRLEDSAPRTFTCAGTALYMAPEVIQGNGYGAECDIWSMGVMFYELVCGSLPFGDNADNVHQVLEEIIGKTLEFPDRYNDNCGKKLMSGLLDKNSDHRLGCGDQDWEDIKSHKFFKQGVTGNLFSKITGRELAAPLVPEKEEWIDETSLLAEKGITLSDNEELGVEEPMDMGVRLLQTFKKFDTNGDGSIDKEELTAVLRALDGTTFTRQVCETLFGMLDTKGDGVISYEGFVTWMLGDKADKDMLKAMRSVFKLDVHI